MEIRMLSFFMHIISSARIFSPLTHGCPNAALDLPETKRQLKLHYTVESFTKSHTLNPYDFLFAVEHMKRWGAVFSSKKGTNNNHESSSYDTHYMSSLPNSSFVWGAGWNFSHCAILIWTSEINKNKVLVCCNQMWMRFESCGRGEDFQWMTYILVNSSHKAFIWLKI